MSANVPTPAIDFSSRDFASLRASMLDYVASRLPEWQGAAAGDPTDFGVVLIEAFAYLGDILSYYNDRVANESFLATATQRSSVLEQAAAIDYTPAQASAAQVPLTFTITSTVPVTIPAGFQVETSSDDTGEPVIFTTDVDLVSPAGTNLIETVTATEGTVITDEIVATLCGDPDSEYPLLEGPVVVGSIVVRVVETPNGPGNVWQPVTRLLDAGPNDNSYAIMLDENDGVTLLFGNGVNGRVPPRGSTIHAAYRIGGGSEGNVLPNSLTLIVDPTNIIYPSLPVGTLPAQPATISLTNLTTAVGGSDSESTDNIRINAPRALRARTRAVTLSDFRALALSIPTAQVAKARATSAVYTNVVVYVAPPGGGQPSQNLLTQVVNYLTPLSMANVSTAAAGPTYVGIDVELQINVDPRYDQPSVKQQVLNALSSFLDFGVVDFGYRVALSDIYTTVSSILGVRSVVISKLTTAGGAGVADVSIRDNEIPVPGTFAVYATGGIVTSPGTLGDTVGDGTTTQPTAAGNPTVNVIRCDPNSTHVELSWAPGANSTSYDVTAAYTSQTGTVVQTSVIGPFSTNAAVLDLPFIGKGRAATIVFYVNSYNGAVGPVSSTGTSVPYTCEQ